MTAERLRPQSRALGQRPHESDATSVDVVVIGAGASGASLALYLARHSNARVLVLESGTDNQLPPLGAFPRLDQPTTSTQWYRATIPAGSSDPEQAGVDTGCARRTISVPRGVGPGGSLRINGGLWTWADPDEIATWDATVWDAASVRDSYQSVTLALGENVHDDRGSIASMWLEACAEQGIAIHPDINADWSDGVGHVPMNVNDDQRHTPVVELQQLVNTRRNVVLRSECLVQRVSFENGRVVGVTYSDGATGSVATVRTRLVVMCAGAIATPELLIRSGIGPTALLDRLGIEQVAVLDELGQHGWEHAVVELPVQWRNLDDSLTKSLLGKHHFGVALHTTIDDQAVELMPLLRPYGLTTQSASTHDTMTLPIRCTLMTPQSASSLEWSQVDSPHNGSSSFESVIHYGHLQHASDRVVMRKALQLAAEIADHMITHNGLTDVADVDPHWRRELAGPKWESLLFNNLDTAHHLMGTAPMGPSTDPRAVVQASGAVHGVDGLWIGDASIIPQPLSRSVAATAAMIGHHLGRALVRDVLI